MRKLRLIFIEMIILMLLITGCKESNYIEYEQSIPSDTSQTSTTMGVQAEYVKLSQEQAQAMMSEDVIILDVRTQEEYDDGHIANAILLPDYEIQEKAEDIIVDKKQTILVYCRTGRRSELASKNLISLGYEKVYDFGGIVDWKEEIVGHWLYPSYFNYFGGTLPSDVVTPIDFKITQKISNQIPEFTFHITGNNIKRYGEGMLNDNPIYYIMFNDNKIENIEITDNTGVLIQKMSDLITAHEIFEEEMYGLSFNDLNFDGYLDIGMVSYPGGSMRNAPHYYWLWDNSLGQFVENVEMMEISNTFTIETNDEEERLECSKILGIYGVVEKHFKYIDEKFVLIYSYILEIIPSPNEEDKNIRHILIEELVDGKLIITEDSYEDLGE